MLGKGPAVDENPGLVTGRALEGGPATEESPGLDAGSALDTGPAIEGTPGLDATKELDAAAAAVDGSAPLVDRAAEGPRSTDEEAAAPAETVEMMVGMYEASLAASEPDAWLSIAVMASLRKQVPEV